MKQINLNSLLKTLGLVAVCACIVPVHAEDAKAAKETKAKPEAVSLEEMDVFIAGLHPEQRPKDAPVITKVEKPKSWYDRAVTGISKPYPYSFKFLEDQGNWYTPFNRPGMLSPYDLRGWHSAKAAK